jgi:hypothetical protein
MYLIWHTHWQYIFYCFCCYVYCDYCQELALQTDFTAYTYFVLLHNTNEAYQVSYDYDYDHVLLCTMYTVVTAYNGIHVIVISYNNEQ